MLPAISALTLRSPRCCWATLPDGCTLGAWAFPVPAVRSLRAVLMRRQARASPNTPDMVTLGMVTAITRITAIRTPPVSTVILTTRVFLSDMLFRQHRRRRVRARIPSSMIRIVAASATACLFPGTRHCSLTPRSLRPMRRCRSPSSGSPSIGLKRPVWAASQYGDRQAPRRMVMFSVF